jgi:hypothetical protein
VLGKMVKSGDPHNFLKDFRESLNLLENCQKDYSNMLSQAIKAIESQASLYESEKMKFSPIFEQASAASLSISKFLKSCDSLNVSKLMLMNNPQPIVWKQLFQAIDSISGGLNRNDLALQAHWLDIYRFSALSQISLSHLVLEGSLVGR